MRLIDADKYYKEMFELYMKAKWGEREVHFSLLDIYWNLKTEPTVDAIPIEWIRVWILQHVVNHGELFDLLITDWREENERNNC